MSEMKGQIVVYSILGCPHCMNTKKIMGDIGLPYTDVRLDLYPHIKNDVIAKSGRATVPQIYFNEVFVGGNEEFVKLVQDKDRFNALLKEVEENPVPEDGPIIPDPSTAVTEPDPFSMKCEPDEYFLLVDEMKKSSIVSSHRVFLKCQKNSFVGKEFVKWVVEEKGVGEAKAKEMGQNLMDHHFVRSQSGGDKFAGGSELYVLMEDDESQALNGGSISDCVPRSASVIGELLRKMILKLYGVFLSNDGKKVDYEGMKKSDEFQTYVKMTKELQRLNIEQTTREEKLAFFINIYNALVIHSNIERGPPKNLWGRYKFFNSTKYIIGGFPYSLQDIENGVLRANRKGVGQLRKPFGKDDPRLKVALDRHEPLIHFALVCGAKSCPPIKTYTAENVYEELQVAAAAFLENDEACTIEEESKTVKLSAIFKWYHEDFGKDKKELLEFIAQHMKEGPKLDSLQKVINSGNFKVSFLKYDWTTNAK